MNDQAVRPTSVTRKFLGLLILLVGIVFYFHLTNSLDSLSMIFVSPPNLLILAAAPASWIIMTWDLRKRDRYRWTIGLGHTILLAGGISIAVGVMKVMNSLDGPETIGPGLAIALSGSALSTLISFILIAYSHNYSTRYRDTRILEFLIYPIATFLVTLCTVFVVLFALKQGCSGSCSKTEVPKVETQHE